MYGECQYKWYLTYVKKLGSGDSNVHLIFGNAMHTVLQNYLETMYKESTKVADDLDLHQMLHDEMSKEFIEASKSMGKHVANKDEIVEFYMDGIAILEFFKKNRADYFNKKGFELIGIEIPLRADMPRNTVFQGYIDIAIKDISGRIKIIDFKTSTMGWRDSQKKDNNKTSQIVLYKKFYADKFGVSIDLIDVEFIILKRKLYEGVDFPQKRIQRFTPASGKQIVNLTMQKLNEFINACFTESGLYNEDRKYLKVDNEKKCKYCEYFKNSDICGGPKKHSKGH
jgi:hypothetical protein